MAQVICFIYHDGSRIERKGLSSAEEKITITIMLSQNQHIYLKILHAYIIITYFKK